MPGSGNRAAAVRGHTDGNHVVSARSRIQIVAYDHLTAISKIVALAGETARGTGKALAGALASGGTLRRKVGTRLVGALLVDDRRGG